MGAKKVVSRKTALGSIALCIVLSAVVIGVLIQNSNTNLKNQAAAKDLVINSLNSTVSSLNATVGNLNSTVNSLNAQITSLQKQVKSENSTNIILENQLASKSSSLNTADNEISSLQNEIVSNPQVTALQNQLAASQAQVVTLQNQATSYQTTITSLNSQVANLESTIANWDNPVSNAFSLIQITDTQFLSESNPALFNTLTSWIVNNTNALNVSMVVNTGDIINVPGNVTQWQNANIAMMQLYNNGVPYSWCAGNHDIIGESLPQGNANGVWLGGSGDSAFDVSVMQHEPYWVASIFNGSSTAVQFSYGNYRFMIINVAYDANATVLDWMQTLLKCNPNDNVIVTTHNFLTGLGTYGYTPSSQDIAWAANFNNTLSNYPNVFMTLSGHDISEGTAANLRNGNREDIFFNRQQEDSLQGGATARIYTFNMSNPANPVVSVYTYETYANGTGGIPQYLTDRLDQFRFTTNLTAYAPSPVGSISAVFWGSSGFSTNFATPITLTGYNQTGDLLRFYNLTFNGVTSNLTISSVGANMVINNYNSTGISYTVNGGVGTQTFLTNALPTSVIVDNATQTPPGNNWNYQNGTVTVTGATQSVTINFT
ncbi:MAG: metallophosphoesterase [Candidatus Bathyarchaeia archaeon]|jgi:peptidoglycan hydrolase CwlO-like protein